MDIENINFLIFKSHQRASLYFRNFRCDTAHPPLFRLFVNIRFHSHHQPLRRWLESRLTAEAFVFTTVARCTRTLGWQTVEIHHLFLPSVFAVVFGLNWSRWLATCFRLQNFIFEKNFSNNDRLKVAKIPELSCVKLRCLLEISVTAALFSAGFSLSYHHAVHNLQFTYNFSVFSQLGIENCSLTSNFFPIWKRSWSPTTCVWRFTPTWHFSTGLLCLMVREGCATLHGLSNKNKYFFKNEILRYFLFLSFFVVVQVSPANLNLKNI